MNAPNTTVRRVVAKLDPTLYVKLYGLKLREGKSLETLLGEAVALLIETRQAKRQDPGG